MIHLYTAPEFLQEKTYACTVLFQEIIGIPFAVHTEQGLTHYKIGFKDGVNLMLEDHFFRHQNPDSYLRAEHVPTQVFDLAYSDKPDPGLIGIFGNAVFQHEGNTIRCGLDIIASAFFMLTRWEEYALPNRDQYGRFPAHQALAYKHGFLDRPVVNEYARFLKPFILRHHQSELPNAQSGRLHISHDVDHPRLWWSAKDKLRTLGGSIAKRRSPGEAAWWAKYMINNWRSDPYDIFKYWLQEYEKLGVQAHFNFMGDRPVESDCYYSLQHPFVLNILNMVAEAGHHIGFHPSREAAADASIFRRELDSVQQVSPVPVKTGRQHYLSFSVPKTWRMWEKANMDWESSLGYPEAEGFRCGICCEFPVYDILERKQLDIREKPLLAMDVTLARYQGYKPAQALEKLNTLKSQVDKHKGEFVLLWHNSSWNTYFWEPWQKVFTEFIASY